MRWRRVPYGCCHSSFGSAAYFAGNTVVVLSLAIPPSSFGTASQVVESTVETIQVPATTSGFGIVSKIVGSIVAASCVTAAQAAASGVAAAVAIKMRFPSNLRSRRSNVINHCNCKGF
jgi:hypothetical protein